MGSPYFGFGNALAVALCSILIVLFVIFLFRRDLLLRAVKNLATGLIPLALALTLWLLIRWPSPYLKDEIMLASSVVLAVLGLLGLVLYLVRSLFTR